jgi:hypothetical protein
MNYPIKHTGNGKRRTLRVLYFHYLTNSTAIAASPT